MGTTIGNPITTSNQTMPPGNLTVCVPVVAQLASAASVTIDLTNQQRTGRFAALQSVFIDNSGNLEPFSLNMSGSNMTVECPPEYQGWVPIASVNPPIFTASSGGGVNVPLFFMNVPMPVGFWPTTAPGQATPVTLTDRSIASTAAGASTLLMAANPARRYFGIVAPQGVTVWINPLGGVAGVSAVGCFPLSNGQLYEPPSEGVTASAITYYDAAGGHVLAAWEG